MNQIIAGIYGTGGHEKVAAEGGSPIADLSDLSLLIAIESGVDTEDIEKVASVHDVVLADLVEYDHSGRAMAHHEFSTMEAEAAAGNTSALEAFFSDVAPTAEKTASRKEAIKAELRRRAG